MAPSCHQAIGIPGHSRTKESSALAGNVQGFKPRQRGPRRVSARRAEGDRKVCLRWSRDESWWRIETPSRRWGPCHRMKSTLLFRLYNWVFEAVDEFLTLARLSSAWWIRRFSRAEGVKWERKFNRREAYYCTGQRKPPPSQNQPSSSAPRIRCRVADGVTGRFLSRLCHYGSPLEEIWRLCLVREGP